jgi:hypothetical protein
VQSSCRGQLGVGERAAVSAHPLWLSEPLSRSERLASCVSEGYGGHG